MAMREHLRPGDWQEGLDRAHEDGTAFLKQAEEQALQRLILGEQVSQVSRRWVPSLSSHGSVAIVYYSLRQGNSLLVTRSFCLGDLVSNKTTHPIRIWKEESGSFGPVSS